MLQPGVNNKLLKEEYFWVSPLCQGHGNFLFKLILHIQFHMSSTNQSSGWLHCTVFFLGDSPNQGYPCVPSTALPDGLCKAFPLLAMPMDWWAKTHQCLMFQRFMLAPMKPCHVSWSLPFVRQFTQLSSMTLALWSQDTIELSLKPTC